MLLCSSAAVNLHDAAQDFFHKKCNNVSDQLTELSKVVESISGDRGSIFKSVFPRTLLSKLFLPSPPVSSHSRRRSLGFFFSLSPPSNRIQIPQPEFFPPS